MPIGLVIFGGRNRSTSKCGVVVLVQNGLHIFQSLMQKFHGSGVVVPDLTLIERILGAKCFIRPERPVLVILCLTLKLSCGRSSKKRQSADCKRSIHSCANYLGKQVRGAVLRSQILEDDNPLGALKPRVRSDNRDRPAMLFKPPATP